MELYEKRISYLLIGMRKELKRPFYRKCIPHPTIIDPNGSVVYNSSGEAATKTVSEIPDESIQRLRNCAQELQYVSKIVLEPDD